MKCNPTPPFLIYICWYAVAALLCLLSYICRWVLNPLTSKAWFIPLILIFVYLSIYVHISFLIFFFNLVKVLTFAWFLQSFTICHPINKWWIELSPLPTFFFYFNNLFHTVVCHNTEEKIWCYICLLHCTKVPLIFEEIIPFIQYLLHLHLLFFLSLFQAWVDGHLPRKIHRDALQHLQVPI